MIKLAQGDETMAEMFADELDYMLDDMSSNDFFGTEGQLDPRGDYRNGKWTLTNLSD